MEKQRHVLIAQLLEAALALPPGERASFLASSCGQNLELLRDVQALLPAGEAPLTPDPPSAGQPPSTTIPANPRQEGMSGRSFGHYHILDMLGRGGMGEVYRARDTRLGREVAVKFVPLHLAGDEASLRRLEREARTLASVNHPNIATIFGLEYFGDLRLLVMEMVPGETLDQVFSRGPMALEQALPIFRQIGEALEAAHKKGVIHRDLKPANVKLSTCGTVKLLDFGLAKNLEPRASIDLSGSDSIASLTGSGVIVGTPAYMSPEQARGEPIDGRTDIWAFGTLLYESLSGERAFTAATLAELFGNILHGEPDWSRLPANTPSTLDRLIRSCLEKDAAARPQDMERILIRLTQVNSTPSASVATIVSEAAELPTQGVKSLEVGNQRGGDLASPRTGGESGAVLARGSTRHQSVALRFPYRAGGALVALALAAGIFYLFHNGQTSVPQLIDPIQVTRSIGVEDYPTWSRDGATLAYESNEAGNWDIWITQVGGGPPVNRTADHSGSDRYPSFSPDGHQIAFWSDRDGGGFYVMPALGGSPQEVAPTPGLGEVYQSPLAWSPDGSQIARPIYKSDGNRVEAFVQIISVATREPREMRLPGVEEARFDLSWSPDGRYLAYLDVASQLGEVSQLRLLRFADGAAVDLMDGRSNVRSPRWSPDGRHLFFTSNRSGATDWWRLRINEDGTANGEPQRVTTGLEVPNGAFSPDGRKVAYSKGRWVSNAWRVPILKSRPATWADAEQLTFDQAFIEWVDVSPDGRSIAFSSDRSGNQDLWTMPIGQSAARQLTADRAPDWDPNWSPDGKQLAYYSYRSGDREIWLMPATGGAATQLTVSKGVDAGPRWSPDGRRIVFRSERTGDSELWVMSADGTDARQLTNNPAGDYGGTFSPDGKWITFYSNRTGRLQIWRLLSEGGTPELLSRGPGVSPRWAPDGEHIIFAGVEKRQGNLWVLSLLDHTERPLTNFVGKRGSIGYQFPSTDGRFVYFTWRDDVGDIWVMDVVR